MERFIDVARDVVAELEHGTPVLELYPLLRQLEPLREKELGKLKWPGCRFKLDDGVFSVATAHPTLDAFHRTEIDEAKAPLSDNEKTELSNHLSWIVSAWIRVAERQQAPKKVGGRRKGKVKLSKHERDCIRMASNGEKPSVIDEIIMNRQNPIRKNGDEWTWGTAALVIKAAKRRGDLTQKRHETVS